MSRRQAPPMSAAPPTETAGAAVPLTQQIQWAERDLAMRRAAYPVMVEKKQIDADRAAMDLTVMSCMVASLRVFQLQATAAGKKLPKGAKPAPTGAKPVIIYFDTDAARKDFIDMLAGLGVKDIEAPG